MLRELLELSRAHRMGGTMSDPSRCEYRSELVWNARVAELVMSECALLFPLTLRHTVLTAC